MKEKNDVKKPEKIEIEMPLRKVIRHKVFMKLLPISVGISLVVSFCFWLFLSAYDRIEMVGFERILYFIIIPMAASVAVCLFAVMRTSDIMRDKYDEIDEAVQRVAMGHYHKLKKPQQSDMHSVYDSLDTIINSLIEKDARIESIGRKCDLLEIEHEGETCRRLGAKVDPELMSTVLNAVETLTREGRYDDLLEIIDNARQVVDASLEDGNSLRPVADELSRIRRFIEIYEILLQKRIGYRMSIMCNIVNYRIIPNLILPIVQILFDRANVAEHNDYEIGVEVNSSFNNLLIIVRDNNGLVSEDEFSYVINDNKTSAAADDGPLTIGALNRRITAFYGEKYSVKLSVNKLGTAVYVYLPPLSSDITTAKGRK